MLIPVFLLTEMLLAHKFMLQEHLLEDTTSLAKCRTRVYLYENDTCFHKCYFEEEGALNVTTGIFSMPPHAKHHKECSTKVNSTDLCVKSSAIENCVSHLKSGLYNKECEESHKVDTDVHCYNRCLLIKSGHLMKNGKINTDWIIGYMKKDLKKISDLCGDLIDGDAGECARDVNMKACFDNLLQHSERQREVTAKCGMKYKGFPYLSQELKKTALLCYNYCVYVETGLVNETHTLNSKVIADLNLTKDHLDLVSDVCKSSLEINDSCVYKMQYLECVLKNKHFPKETLLRIKECNTKFATDKHCYNKCFLTRENILEENGNPNITTLQESYSNKTLINDAISACGKNKSGNTCLDDLKNYECTITTINQNIRNLCGVKKAFQINAAANSTTTNGVSTTTLTMSFTKTDPCINKCYDVNYGFLLPNGDVNVNYFTKPGVNSTHVQQVAEMCKKNNTNACQKNVDTLKCVFYVLKQTLLPSNA